MKLNDQGQPVNDDGTPITLPEGMVLIKKEEHDKLTDVGKRLDFLEQRITTPASPAAPPSAPAPSGPTLDEQSAKIDADIELIDAEIDDLVTKISSGEKTDKSLAKLNRKRSDLVTKKSDLQWGAKFDNLASQGMSTLAGLTDQVMSSQMPHLVIPAVKQEYDRMLAGLPVNFRTNPAQIKEIYNLAVGRNVAAVTQYQIEEANRKNAQTPSQTPGGTPPPGREPGGKTKVGDKYPTFEEHFGSDAVAELRKKNQTPDDFARKLGYDDAAAYVKFAVDQEGGHA